MSKQPLKWYQLTPEQRFTRATGEHYLIEIEREVIPVIFVPGVMGTRLHNGTGLAWDPDETNNKTWIGWYTARTAAQRKRLVVGDEGHDPKYLTVTENPANVPGTGALHTQRVARGWGGLLASSYMGFMQTFDNFLRDGQLAEDFGQYFDFPLHGFGYNWSADNKVSGLKLKTYIEKLITEYNHKDGLFCKKVILVTHSMGGLVSRWAMSRSKMSDKVLGVVHGVQPVMGGAAAYKRVRAGFNVSSKDPSGIMLGSLSKHVAPIFANSPGPLELLPTKRYTDASGNSKWLRISGGEPSQRLIERPLNGDPYEEIYRQRTVWWRLLNDFEIDPVQNGQEDIDVIWEGYLENLQLAENYHDDIGHWKHPNTYQISGITATIPTYGNVDWTVKVDSLGPWDSPLTDAMANDIRDNPLEHEFASGENRVTGVTCTFECLDTDMNAYLQAPNDPGDGTVPVPSGSRLNAPHVGVPPNSKGEGLPHEGAFREPRVQDLTERAVRRLVKDYFEQKGAS